MIPRRSSKLNFGTFEKHSNRGRLIVILLMFSFSKFSNGIQQTTSRIPTYNLYNLSIGLTITKDLLAITKVTTKDMGVVCMETTETIIPCTEV